MKYPAQPYHRRLALLLAASMLTGFALPAHAGSITQPGETVGFAPGAHVQGWYNP